MFFRTHESVSDEEISFDMEHFNTELDNMKEEVTREGGKEEELVQMVTNIIFTVLWRGKTGRTRKEALAGLEGKSMHVLLGRLEVLVLG